MNMPAISTREKRFNPTTGELIHNNMVTNHLRHPMDRLCDSLDLPITSLGKYVKESREARLLTYCIILGKKLKIIWPKFMENLAIWEFLNEIVENSSNSTISLTRKGDFNTFCVFLGILRKDREINIAKMCFQFRSILRKLKMIQGSLVQYSRSNLGIFEQLKRITVPNFDEIIMSRVKLSDCEKSLSERIEGIIRGFVSTEVNSTIFLSWKEYFERVKRKRQEVRQMIPPQILQNLNENLGEKGKSKNMSDEDELEKKKQDEEEVVVEEEEEEVEPPSKKRKVTGSQNNRNNSHQHVLIEEERDEDEDDDEKEDEEDEEEEDEKILRTRVRGLEKSSKGEENTSNNNNNNNNIIVPPPPPPREENYKNGNNNENPSTPLTLLTQTNDY